jgi:hypothetical protein
VSKLKVKSLVLSACQFVWVQRYELAGRGAVSVFALTALSLFLVYRSPDDPWFIWILLSLYCSTVILLMSFSVSWHRLALFGKASPEAGNFISVRFGRREIKFFGLFLLLNLFAGIFINVVFLLARSSSELSAAVSSVLALFIAVYVCARFLLAFPAAAADEAPALKIAWALSAGNATQIMLALAGVGLPFYTLFAGVYFSFAAANLPLAFTIISSVFTVAGTALTATMLSFAYLDLRGLPRP